MARLEETPSAIDPLDEAYALAPPTVDVSPGRGNGRPHPGAEPGDAFPLSDEWMPPLSRTPTTSRSSLDEGTLGKPEPARFNDPARFTLRNLLLVITMASVVLAIGIRFPRSYFAGGAGLAALVTAVSASWLRNGGAVLQLAWWTLLGIYLMACTFALIGL